MKKLLFFFVYCLLSTAYCYSQTWQWVKSGGGTGGSTGVDVGRNIAVNKNGESFAAGNFMSNPAVFGSTNLSLTGWSDVFIVKYDSNGNAVWAKKAGAADNIAWTASDVGYGIAADNLGNCYVTGEMNGSNPTFDTITLPSTSNRTFFLAKYNSNGDCQWAKMASGGISYGRNIIASDKSVYAGGVYTGNVLIDTNNLNGPGGGFIARYNPNTGKLLWVKEIIAGGVGDCVMDKQNNCYVAGAYFGSANFNSITLSGGNYYIAKYDSSGNVLWAKNSYSYWASIDNHGNVFTTMYFKDTIMIDTFQLISAGGWDIAVSKYDSAGNCLWAKRFGGTGNDKPGDGGPFGKPISTNSSSVFLLGFSENSYTSGACSVDSGEYILAIDSNGNCLGNIPLPTKTRSIAADAGNNVYLTSEYQNSVTFGLTTLTSSSGSAPDVFVAKLNTVVSGVPSNNQRSTNFNIYPNPSDGTYTMEISPDLFQSKMHIYDSTGREIFQTTISKETTLINLPTLSSGAYIVKLQTQDGKTLERSIIKQ